MVEAPEKSLMEDKVENDDEDYDHQEAKLSRISTDVISSKKLRIKNMKANNMTRVTTEVTMGDVYPCSTCEKPFVNLLDPEQHFVVEHESKKHKESELEQQAHVELRVKVRQDNCGQEVFRLLPRAHGCWSSQTQKWGNDSSPHYSRNVEELN